MDNKLKATIDKIVLLSKQNPEFGIELRKSLGIAFSTSTLPLNDKRIDQIYEYCIEKVVRRQAQEFYSEFPFPSIKEVLIEDFCRMETFRRKNNFGDFCLSVYQQIECMTNTICAKPDLSIIAEHMWGYPAYIKTGVGITPSVEVRTGEYTVASCVFPGNDKKTGLPNSIEKSKSALQSLSAKDKIRCVVYFIGYKAAMKNSDYDYYKEFTYLLSDLYQCRNMNHRGNKLVSWEKGIIDKITPYKSVYYLKFLGALTLYVEQIKDGWKNIPSLKNYAESLPYKDVKVRHKSR